MGDENEADEPSRECVAPSEASCEEQKSTAADDWGLRTPAAGAMELKDVAIPFALLAPLGTRKVIEKPGQISSGLHATQAFVVEL